MPAHTLTPAPTRLSKSKFMAGLQCTKQLWWQIHEPDAEELIPDAVRQAIFDQGNEVSAKAREYIPGGVLVTGRLMEDRINRTKVLISQGTPIIYEAAIEYDGTLVKVDILESKPTGWTLIEVKSSTKVKPEHIPDAAVQLHVLRGAGLNVDRVELMHLNTECRYPDLSNLFLRQDITTETEAFLPAVANNLEAFVSMLDGQLPPIDPGPHCRKPYECPFMSRCCPTPPLHSIDTLYCGTRGNKIERLRQAGASTLDEIPLGTKLNAIQERQRASAQCGGVVVTENLGNELAALEYPIAFLDFETIMPAIPVWGGCRPYDQIPVQVSVHTLNEDGSLSHAEWLAEGSGDPRRRMAEHIIKFTAGARTVLVYSQSFEERRIRELEEAVPHLSTELEDLRTRLADLLPLVRDNIYHPEFRGQFSIKSVLPALVPDLRYDQLEIQDGGLAAAALKELLLGDPGPEHETTRQNLLAYCRLDTLAMVRILEHLHERAA